MNEVSKSPEPRARARVTDRGLEITFSMPWAFVGVLSALIMIAMVPLMIVVMVTTELTGTEPKVIDVLEYVFGQIWLWVGAVMIAALIAFDRFSNEHFIIGPKLVERQFRCGRIVLNRERYPLAWVSKPGFEREKKSWYVVWQWRNNDYRRWKLNRVALSREEAEAVSDRLGQWMESPGGNPVAEADSQTSLSMLESMISLVSGRFGTAVPLLLGLAGLLFLAQGWQLLQELDSSDGDIADRFEIVPGQLLQLNWVFDPSTRYAQLDTGMKLEAMIGFDVDGQAHTLGLVGRKFESFRLRFPDLYPRAAAFFGSEPVRFLLSPSVVEDLPADSSWPIWSDLRWDRDQDLSHSMRGTLELLVELDNPRLYLTIRDRTEPSDLRVAYPPGRPDRATLLSWLEAEQAARENVYWPFLVPVTAFAVLLIVLTLPGVFTRSRHRTWIARLAILLLLAALPWWADRAETLPRWLGLDNLIWDLSADVLRLHWPQRDHLWLRPARAPLSDGAVIDWTLEQSASFELLRTMGIVTLGPKHSSVVIKPVETAWLDSATRAMAAFSEPELGQFAIDYVEANGAERYRPLHGAVIRPAFCSQRNRLQAGFRHERLVDLHFRCEQ